MALRSSSIYINALVNVLAQSLLLAAMIAWVTPCTALTNTGNQSAKQSLVDVQAAATTFVRESIQKQMGLSPGTLSNSAPTNETIATAVALDPRLQLQQCAGSLQAFTLNNAALTARNTIGVRCREGAEWTVYLQVSVDSNIDVLILRHPAARDTQLVAADVDRQHRRVPGFGSQYVTDVTKLADYRVKRMLPADVAITTEMLRRDAVIRRGQQVTLITTIAGIDVRASGIALADGGNSDRIRVQNVSSLKIVEGVVETGNTVRVGM